jgi:aldose 1-epimerase
VDRNLEVVVIKNGLGMELKISNFGAVLLGLKLDDKNGNPIDVIQGLAMASDYIQEPYTNIKLFLGCSIGRYAGRISGGSFKVDEKIYAINHEDGVHLHGGNGFDKKYWTIKELEKNSVSLSYLSQHLEEGYPGNLEVIVKYELTENNSLKITYKATTDQPTPVNLTSHPYLNLNGKGSILDHYLTINSKQHLEVDEKLLPTGKILESTNTPFDRNQKLKIKEQNFTGFDDTFILGKENLKATLYSKESGIKMNIYSNQPAMVVYTPKKFPKLPFKKNQGISEYPAICFEPQNFPDAPHYSHFPNSILYPEEFYFNEIEYEFVIDHKS